MKARLFFLALLLCAYESKDTPKRLKFVRWISVQIFKIYEWKVFKIKYILK